MTSAQKKQALKQFLIERLSGKGRVTVDDAVVELRNFNGAFTPEGYANAQAEYERGIAAKAIRSIGEDKLPMFHHVESTDEQGNVTHEYVQLPLLNLEEFKQVGDYRLNMVLRHMKVLKQVALECRTQHNRKLPIQLSLIEQEMEELRPLSRNAPATRATHPSKQKKGRAEPSVNK